MQQRNYNYGYTNNAQRHIGIVPDRALNKPVHTNPQTKTKIKIKSKKVKKKMPFMQKVALFFCFLLMSTIILPYSFYHTTKEIFINPFLTRNIKIDYHSMFNRVTNIVHNDYFLGQKFISQVETEVPQMQKPYMNSEITQLTDVLRNIATKYPKIEPTVFVWDFKTGNWAGLNPDKMYSAASIIKLPVLIELFKSVENGELKLTDKMILENYFRAEGSGALQYQASGNQYSLDFLARTMIENSDNSSTNMLITKLGSMVNINRSIRKWGLSNTYLANWLPDMQGTNYTTARDLATMLYNIDNPSFLSLNSREKIFDYMGHVKNDRLLKAGLPANASIAHKTGDIGKTLGDAGIIHTHTGERYIIVVMANRPYNSPQGKNYIIETSSAVYNYMVNGLK